MGLIEWWTDPFLTSQATRMALAVSVLAIISLSVVGTWVVMRGLSFFGDALAHGVLPGVAVAFLLGVDVRLGALAAAVLMVAAISAIRSTSPLPEDTSIGVLFVGFLALAIVIISKDSGGVGDLDRFLFGSLTWVGTDDLVRQGLATIVVVVTTVVLHRALLATTFDETQAAMLGFNPQRVNTMLLGLVAASIVFSFESVGSLLVFAFLVAPPAAAALVFRRLPSIMVGAAAIGVLSAIVGLALSYHHDTAPEATVALAATGFFGLALVLRRTLILF